MNKVWSYPKLTAVAAISAIGLLLCKFVLRSVTPSTPIIKGDELEDTVLWFIMLVVVFALYRSNIIRSNAISEIRREDSDDSSNQISK